MEARGITRGEGGIFRAQATKLLPSLLSSRGRSGFKMRGASAKESADSVQQSAEEAISIWV